MSANTSHILATMGHANNADRRSPASVGTLSELKQWANNAMTISMLVGISWAPIIVRIAK